MTFAIVLAVGPGAEEIERTVDLFDSLAAHEPAETARIVVVDDSENDRDLERVLPAPASYSLTVLSHLRRGSGHVSQNVGGPLCCGMLQAYQWLARDGLDGLSFILKLDTDALVIAPFAKKLTGAFEDRPRAGMIGAYTRTPNGDQRDVSHHAGIMKEMHLLPHSWREPKSMLRHFRARRSTSADRIARHLAAACEHGYEYGEHCLGGAYAVAPEVLRRMCAAGYLDDPALWLPTRSGEDTMLSAYVRAVGMELDNFVNDGDAFGIRYKGLADTPAKLLERGYSVVHSVKNEPSMSEAAIRAFYRDRRTRARDGESASELRSASTRRDVAVVT